MKVRTQSIEAVAVLVFTSFSAIVATVAAQTVPDKPANHVPSQHEETSDAIHLGDDILASFFLPEISAELSIVAITTAAMGGNADAQFAIGVLLYRGDRIPKDFSRALVFFERAADQDHIYATINLGAMYLHGVGVPRNPSRAMELMHNSAAIPFAAPPQYSLGLIYSEGLGIARDRPEGYKWLRLAISNGAPEVAAKKLALLTATMTPDEIRKGNELYEGYKETGERMKDLLKHFKE